MTKLVGINTPNKQPVKSVQEALKTLTEMADAGDLRELAYCGLKQNGKAVWDFIGEIVDENTMFTNLTHLTNRYYTDICVEDEE